MQIFSPYCSYERCSLLLVAPIKHFGVAFSSSLSWAPLILVYTAGFTFKIFPESHNFTPAPLLPAQFQSTLSLSLHCLSPASPSLFPTEKPEWSFRTYISPCHFYVLTLPSHWEWEPVFTIADKSLTIYPCFISLASSITLLCSLPQPHWFPCSSWNTTSQLCFCPRTFALVVAYNQNTLIS